MRYPIEREIEQARMQTRFFVERVAMSEAKEKKNAVAFKVKDGH